MTAVAMLKKTLHLNQQICLGTAVTGIRPPAGVSLAPSRAAQRLGQACDCSPLLRLNEGSASQQLP